MHETDEDIPDWLHDAEGDGPPTVPYHAGGNAEGADHHVTENEALVGGEREVVLDDVDAGSIAVATAESANAVAVLSPAGQILGLDSSAALGTRSEQLEGLRAIEDRLLSQSLVATEASLAFADLDLEDLEGSKAKFVAQYGKHEGMKRFRVALANWQNAKTAPVGIKNSIAVTLGLLKSKSGREAAPQHLNLTFVQMTAPKEEILEAITVDE